MTNPAHVDVTFERQQPEYRPMNWRKVSGLGLLIGGSIGIVLALPVVFLDPAYLHGIANNMPATFGGWAIGGAICGCCVSLLICAIDCRMSRLPITTRRQSRSRQFLRITFGILALAAFAGLIPLWLSHGAYRTDGAEVIGWPFVFFSRGGNVYIVKYHYANLLFNIGIWTAFALLIAFMARYGVARFSIRMLLFLRNGLGASKRSGFVASKPMPPGSAGTPHG